MLLITAMKWLILDSEKDMDVDLCFDDDLFEVPENFTQVCDEYHRNKTKSDESVDVSMATEAESEDADDLNREFENDDSVSVFLFFYQA